jgi:hypothetical protein
MAEPAVVRDYEDTGYFMVFQLADSMRGDQNNLPHLILRTHTASVYCVNLLESFLGGRD